MVQVKPIQLKWNGEICFHKKKIYELRFGVDFNECSTNITKSFYQLNEHFSHRKSQISNFLALNAKLIFICYFLFRTTTKCLPLHAHDNITPYISSNNKIIIVLQTSSIHLILTNINYDCCRLLAARCG